MREAIFPFKKEYALLLNYDETVLQTRWIRNFSKSKRFGKTRDVVNISKKVSTVIDSLELYFQGISFKLPYVEPTGLTEFQKKVCRIVHAIPWGEVLKYGEVAAQSGHFGAARAVGSVMSGNMMPVLIPCHRVVPAGGGLGKYSEYPELKKLLLDHERQ